MIRWATFLVSAVLGLRVASLVTKLAAKNAPAFLGGVGFISTLVALLISSLSADGLVTALATFTLPFLLRPDTAATSRSTRSAGDVSL